MDENPYPVVRNKGKNSKTNSWFKNTIYMKPNGTKLKRKTRTLKKKTVLRAYKVKLYPTIKQTIMLNEWIEVCRLVYNETIAYQKTLVHPILDFKTLRDT